MASKRGLCWPTTNTDPAFLFTKPGSHISWLYNWSPLPTPSSSSLQFVPMQWNHVNMDALASHAAAARAPAVLGFNEPELRDQANMPVALAAREWLRCVEPLRRAGVRCGSPGISSAPEGVPWLREFLRVVREGGGDVDFYALHWYGETLGQFYDYLWSVYHQLGADRPVWVTEFAATNWSVERPLERGHVEGFCRDSCKYLDGLEWVERYAWFGAMRDTGTVGKWAALLDGNGKLTPLGKAYRDA
ncbi:hypothetical protein B0T25DRAFT_542122 [Lasiosphaeria hispida]|uniref:Asl1-like glycosyl hydrolase catalytic domain-containing protein n=1 Tax=Lasiosphaeria hispida TaxID=260671 RepID=A0AAJ0HHG2_9PEZI|nr:hypothetical protein B0T25DRAFT_542122 [Lasiosphaeria hispida]